MLLVAVPPPSSPSACSTLPATGRNCWQHRAPAATFVILTQLPPKLGLKIFPVFVGIPFPFPSLFFPFTKSTTLFFYHTVSLVGGLSESNPFKHKYFNPLFNLFFGLNSTTTRGRILGVCIRPNPQPSQRESKTLSSSRRPPRTLASTSPWFAQYKKSHRSRSRIVSSSKRSTFSYAISNEIYICQLGLRKHWSMSLRHAVLCDGFATPGLSHRTTRAAETTVCAPNQLRIDRHCRVSVVRLTGLVTLEDKSCQKRSSYMWLWP